MKIINEYVSMYEKPALGKIDGTDPTMALSIDKSTINDKIKKGIARKITSRTGSSDIPGFLDKSQLILVESNNLLEWKTIKPLIIKNAEKIITEITPKDYFFIGLEDPDIFSDDNDDNGKNVYFTIAFRHKAEATNLIWLGHASGPNLENLEMQNPIISPIKGFNGFKEISFSPDKRKTIILTEGMDKTGYSVICAFEKSSSQFKFLGPKLHPTKGENWCKLDASPCYIFPKEIFSHNNLLLALINGREKSSKIREKTIFGKFRPGLVLFDPITGEIPWISPTPLFEDPKASTITFASDLILLNSKEALLYAHINDSFVRVYKIDLEKIKSDLKTL